MFKLTIIFFRLNLKTMLMDLNMMESLSEIKGQAKVFITMPTVINTLGNGRTIDSMEMESIFSQTENVTKESSERVSRQVVARITTLMEINTKETGQTIKKMEKEFITTSPLARSMMETGGMERKTAKEFTFMLMETNISVGYS